MIRTKLNFSLQDSTSTANKLFDVPIADSVIRAENEDTERPGTYWEKFRQRQGGPSQSQPQTQVQQPHSQSTSAPQSQPTARVDDFVHPSRKAANFEASKNKLGESKRPRRALREAAQDGHIKTTRLEPRADKARPSASPNDEAEHEPTRADRCGRILPRDMDLREDSCRRPSLDGRERDSSFDDPYRRSPARGGERDFTPGSRRQRADSRDRKEAQGGALQASSYIHPSRMALVSPAPEPVRDSKPQERKKNERPDALENRAQPSAGKKTVLSAADGHQWANSGGDNSRGRGRERGRGGNQRGGRGRGRGFGGGDRYVPSPPPSWSDSRFDQVYKRR